MAWRVAGSVLALHRQLKREASRAAPPATATSSWGTIADLAHSSTSDHAPKDFPGWGNDIVTAGDFPNVPGLGLSAWLVLDSIRRSRDPRAKYGISNGMIFSSYATASRPAWTWGKYTGSDGHFTHGHLSVVGDRRADQDHLWATGLTIITEDPLPDQIEIDAAYNVAAILQGTPVAEGNYAGIVPDTKASAARIEATLQQVLVEQAALRALLQQVLEAGGTPDAAVIIEQTQQAIDQAVARLTQDTRDAVADLGEGGSAKVRADAPVGTSSPGTDPQ